MDLGTSLQDEVKQEPAISSDRGAMGDGQDVTSIRNGGSQRDDGDSLIFNSESINSDGNQASQI